MVRARTQQVSFVAESDPTVRFGTSVVRGVLIETWGDGRSILECEFNPRELAQAQYGTVYSLGIRTVCGHSQRRVAGVRSYVPCPDATALCLTVCFCLRSADSLPTSLLREEGEGREYVEWRTVRAWPEGFDVCVWRSSILEDV